MPNAKNGDKGIMVDFRSIDDIERDKNNRERETLKKNISKDINDVLGSVMDKRRQKAIEKRKKRKWWVKLLLALLVLGLLVITLDFVLGSLWLLKFFVKDLFNLKV